MKRMAVRNIGSVKKRRNGKYAIDAVNEKDSSSMCLIFGGLWLESTNEEESDEYFMLLSLFAGQVEEIQETGSLTIINVLLQII